MSHLRYWREAREEVSPERCQQCLPYSYCTAAPGFVAELF